MDLDKEELKATREKQVINKIVAGIDLNYDDYIHKDTIRKKIEKLKKERLKFESSPFGKWDLYRKIEVLQELLKEK